jgi:hypothetical protein
MKIREIRAPVILTKSAERFVGYTDKCIYGSI